ncbi:MAG TPA: DUF2189 domain-containing protein [Hyphomicrobiaceae bacterium]|nr:DUF2189 domain-containing protein [Hyphomicrobiaceae bacterium]
MVTGPAASAPTSSPASEHSRQAMKPGIKIRTVAFDAPWDWLAAGWRDMWAVSAISLTYGAAFALGAVLMLIGFVTFGLQSVMLVLAGGFLLIGPLVAVGLYEASRMLERHETPAFGDVIQAGFKAPGQLGFLGAILLFAFFAWIQIALLLFMMFMGSGSTFPTAQEFLPTLLFTSHGLSLLVVGTIVGAFLAAAVFAISAISVPLLMTRQLDAVTAILASVKAVRMNIKPMALWAVLIAAFITLGIATLFVGLIFAFPLIGHATWHAFRELVAD